MNNNNNKSQFLSTREAIIKWLDGCNIKNYTINDDLSVDVNGDVKISHRKLKAIPVKFGTVIGDFRCQNNKLTNLIGTPKIINGSFWCNNNKLKALFGAPEIIRDNFYCQNNSLLLTSLIEINCFGYICINVDKKSFIQKEVFNIIDVYYDTYGKLYRLTAGDFRDKIKPVLEKEILQEKLKHSAIKIKTKTSKNKL